MAIDFSQAVMQERLGAFNVFKGRPKLILFLSTILKVTSTSFAVARMFVTSGLPSRNNRSAGYARNPFCRLAITPEPTPQSDARRSYSHARSLGRRDYGVPLTPVRKMHPPGDDIFHSGCHDASGVSMCPFGWPDQSFAPFGPHRKAEVVERGFATVFYVVKIGHPGQNAVHVAKGRAFGVDFLEVTTCRVSLNVERTDVDVVQHCAKKRPLLRVIAEARFQFREIGFHRS